MIPKLFFSHPRAICGFRRFSNSIWLAGQSQVERDLIVPSPLPDIPTVTGFTIPELIRENFGSWGHLTAFRSYETGRSYTHDEVLKHSRGLGAALIQSGFKRGDVIAIVLPNVPEYSTILFGIWEAGCVVSPVNPSYSSDEIKRQLEMSDAVCVITEKEYLPSVLKSRDLNPNIRSVVVVGEPEEGCHTFHEMIKADTFGIEFFKGSSVDTTEDLALLPFSSGTTGPPKGVMLTHANLTTNLMQCDPSTGIGLGQRYTPDIGQERLLGLLPFFHAYGLSCLIHLTMSTGADTICLRKFDKHTFLAAVRQHRPTTFHLVTPLINHIVNSDDYGKAELAAAHTVCGGAAPIGPVLINKLLEKAGKYFFFQEGYGMTETAPVTHVLLPETKNTKVGSCGTPVPSTLTKIIDPNGKTLGRNERGEICMKGAQVMKGYYKNEEATRKTLDEDGWIHTGDIAYYDDDGCLFIVDRLKELIKVQGLQVAPSELEDLLRQHQAVDDVAIIGVPNEKTGEAPRAYVVRKSNETLSEEDIHQYLKPLVSKHKYLNGGIEFIDSIPKAPSGKILRRELMDEYKKQQT